MRWGIFSLSQIPDQQVVVETMDEHFSQFRLAEELGYDSIWIAEHLFSTYGIVTSSQVLAAAIARVTSRVRIGTGVVVVPFNHPLRTAGDFGFVDVLSHGRLDFGVDAPTSRTSSWASDCPWIRAARCSTKAWTSS